MSGLKDLLVRNRDFAAAEGHLGTQVMPTLGLGIVTCLDPRVDPASFLGLKLSEAMVLRNAGGRVTDRVLADLSFTTFMAQTMAAGAGDRAGIEIAVIHHTQCGTGFLADDGFRASYAAHSGYSADELAAEAVTDPFTTVRHDTEILRAHRPLPDTVTVSGHVYDLATGEVTTVVPADLVGTAR